MPRISIDFDFYEELSYQTGEGYIIPEVVKISGDYAKVLSNNSKLLIENALIEGLTEVAKLKEVKE